MNNNLYFLLKVVRIQQVDSFFTAKGFTRGYIHVKIIGPSFFVGKTTYYGYLSINAKKQLREKHIDWKDHLEEHMAIDYMGLMAALEGVDTLKKETYYKMLREGARR